MKKFILRSLGFILLVVPILLFISLFFKLDGFTDPYYLRFTTPRQSSLVIGTSRAAQGIQPMVLNKALGRSDIYNYAFSIAHSPYGPTYFKSIKSKLREDTRDGIFIVTVDPWSICGLIKNPDDSSSFKESGLALGEVDEVNVNPNIFYLWRSYDQAFFHLFLKDTSTGIFLHNDGWLEISAPMDSEIVSKRIQFKLEDYQNIMLPKYKFSTLRMEYLVKTIGFLQTHGSVFLVRMPVYPGMSDIEDKLMPDFDKRIDSISLKMKVRYKNFKADESQYQFVDGNHLYKTSGAKVSAEIAEWIKN